MEMNGTLEAKVARLKSKKVRGRSEEDAQDEEEEDEEEVVTQKEIEGKKVSVCVCVNVRTKLVILTFGFYFKAADSQPKEKGLSRRHKVLLSNGKVSNGGPHLTNGSHSRAALNSGDSQEGSVNELLNGNHAGNENCSAVCNL